MLRIRLSRVGKKGHPSYRIVVADVAAPRDGSYLEWIGNYDPMKDPPAVTLKAGPGRPLVKRWGPAIRPRAPDPRKKRGHVRGPAQSPLRLKPPMWLKLPLRLRPQSKRAARTPSR